MIRDAQQLQHGVEAPVLSPVALTAFPGATRVLAGLAGDDVLHPQGNHHTPAHHDVHGALSVPHAPRLAQVLGALPGGLLHFGQRDQMEEQQGNTLPDQHESGLEKGSLAGQ
jgi:hypothetical protein